MAPGISQKIVAKIFQPFFTTKPTGEGTGLGLSLSYDIIKAHGGEIKVETRKECLQNLLFSYRKRKNIPFASDLVFGWFSANTG
jgi:signal transduction histidine kinase